MSSSSPLQEAPTDHSSAIKLESKLTLPRFNADDAFTLGTNLRTRIRTLSEIPCVINITSTNSDNLLFHCCTRTGIAPDNDIWVARKRATVKRWGISSWAVGRKYEGNEERFAQKLMLGNRAGEYAIHGGGVPVKVDGVEGVVAVVVVSGLKQQEDHMVVVEGLEALKASMQGAGQSSTADAGVGDVTVEETGSQTEAVAENQESASTEEARVLVDEQRAEGAVYAS